MQVVLFNILVRNAFRLCVRFAGLGKEDMDIPWYGYDKKWFQLRQGLCMKEEFMMAFICEWMSHFSSSASTWWVGVLERQSILRVKFAVMMQGGSISIMGLPGARYIPVIVIELV